MDAQPTPEPARTSEVFGAFLWQGLTAFGGPLAHLGYFRREFVTRRAWLTEGQFVDLLALCSFLPGATSSQLGMAIGLRRAGLAGALAAWLGFTLPAGLVMITLGTFLPLIAATWGDGWLKGLKVAAAAVVLQALIAMWRGVIKGPIQAGMALGGAAGLILAHGPVAQVLAIAAGGLLGRVLLTAPAPEAPPPPGPTSLRPPLAALIAFAVLLGLLPLLAGLLQSPLASLASVFYRAGALVFGGGHVVLPLLQSEVVGRGWLDQDTFLAGYGAVQALPGPLFSFGGFVGAATNGWLGGLVALIAIFLPSLLLVLGVVPLWGRIQLIPGARGAADGAAAVAVGLLAAALWNPVLSSTVRQPTDWALVAAAFVFLAVAKMPPWLVVAGFALATAMFLR